MKFSTSDQKEFYQSENENFSSIIINEKIKGELIISLDKEIIEKTIGN